MEDISRLDSLTVLNLTYNKIEYLPESIVNLKSLKELWLSNNPIAKNCDSRTKTILELLKKKEVNVEM